MNRKDNSVALLIERHASEDAQAEAPDNGLDYARGTAIAARGFGERLALVLCRSSPDTLRPDWVGYRVSCVDRE